LSQLPIYNQRTFLQIQQAKSFSEWKQKTTTSKDETGGQGLNEELTEEQIKQHQDKLMPSIWGLISNILPFFFNKLFWMW